ncbi:MAG: hypothetical protein HY744_25525 [Deltaproteobacteria bacterium]|nr:hypothetical protein [Deltaproteobacteria bacterium]
MTTLVWAGLLACGEGRGVPTGVKPFDWCDSDEVATITVQAAGAMVEAQKGNVALVIFYSSRCKLSKAFFPTFLQLSDEFEDDGLKVFAFSTEECEKNLADFLAPQSISFEPTVLVPWVSGELTAAFANIGITFATPWMKPLVAVVGKDGKAARQWTPASEYDTDQIRSVIETETGE